MVSRWVYGRETRRTKSEYAKVAVVPLKDCTIGYSGINGTEHSISVTADSLYEAVAKALAVFRSDKCVAEIGTGVTELRVNVKSPVITHAVKVKDFVSWLERAGRSPAEVTMKNKLRELLKSQ